MRVFCMLCKDHILNTTDKFIVGGPYNGSMFEAARPGLWRGIMFKTIETVKNANLSCPRCEMSFIQRGKLLTEHGVIHPNQASVDTSFSIVQGPEGSLPGRLMYIKDSIELPGIDRVGEAARARQAEMDRLEKQDLTTVDIEKQEYENNLSPYSGPLICPKCAKEYTNTEKGRVWYKKHIESCGK